MRVLTWALLSRPPAISELDALLTEAMLNPEVPRSAEPQIIRRLVRRLEALGLVSAADEPGRE